MQMSSVLRAPVDNGIYSATRESSHESTGEGLRAVISKVFELLTFQMEINLKSV